jgi:hypothetical protein
MARTVKRERAVLLCTLRKASGSSASNKEAYVFCHHRPHRT